MIEDDNVNYKEKYFESFQEKAVWETYKSQMEVKLKHLEQSEEELKYQLFNWMTLAIRLDTLSRSPKETLKVFNKDEVYDSLIDNKIAYSSWPKIIMQELEKKDPPTK